MTYITSVEKIGFKRGLQEGERKGLQEGELKGKQEIVLSMLEEQMPLETIARLSNLSVEQIQEIQSQQQ